MAYSNDNSLIKIGKIRKYENSVGEIVSNAGNFMFTEDCIASSETINVDDYVLFRGEEIGPIKKAFFLRKIDLTNPLDKEITAKTKTKILPNTKNSEVRE